MMDGAYVINQPTTPVFVLLTPIDQSASPADQHRQFADGGVLAVATVLAVLSVGSLLAVGAVGAVGAVLAVLAGLAVGAGLAVLALFAARATHPGRAILAGLTGGTWTGRPNDYRPSKN